MRSANRCITRQNSLTILCLTIQKATFETFRLWMVFRFERSVYSVFDTGLNRFCCFLKVVRKNWGFLRKSLRTFESENTVHLELRIGRVSRKTRHFRLASGHGRVKSGTVVLFCTMASQCWVLSRRPNLISLSLCVIKHNYVTPVAIHYSAYEQVYNNLLLFS